MERTAVAGQGKVQNIARSRLGCVARYHRSMTEDSGWSVIPSIRVPDMQTALEFYTGVLGFTLDSSEPTADNSSLHRGSARIMLELPSNHFSDAYNQAIRERLGSVSATALYIEAPDLEVLYERVRDAGVTIVDPLAYRPWKQHEFTIEDHVGNWLTFWDAPKKRLPE